ncbi:MAG: SRPBCC family protein [Acidimicrobiales bacterium]
MIGLALAALAAAGGLGYRLVVAGQLTLDTGVGRARRPLGPVSVAIAAPREVVFDLIAGPYLGRTPRALAEEISVLERGADMVLAAHRTPVGGGRVATTVETVRFHRPETVDFRLVRGPVPFVVERFTLHDDDGATRLDYDGELGTDFWAAGRWWGARVAAVWEATVRSSLERLRVEAERRSTRNPG